MATDYQNQQSELPTGPEPISAHLARRIAEAADGLRDGKTYYFVSKKYFPFYVEAYGGATSTEALAAAEAALAEKNLLIPDHKEKYTINGPFLTIEEHGYAPESYDHIEVRYLKDGEGDEKIVTKSIFLDPGTDAIVLSLSAFDKFFLPYYTRLLGAEVALDFRSKVAVDIKSSPSVHTGTQLQGSSRGPITYLNKYPQ